MRHEDILLAIQYMDADRAVAYLNAVVLPSLVDSRVTGALIMCILSVVAASFSAFCAGGCSKKFVWIPRLLTVLFVCGVIYSAYYLSPALYDPPVLLEPYLKAISGGK